MCETGLLVDFCQNDFFLRQFNLNINLSSILFASKFHEFQKTAIFSSFKKLLQLTAGFKKMSK